MVPLMPGQGHGFEAYTTSPYFSCLCVHHAKFVVTPLEMMSTPTVTNEPLFWVSMT